MKRAFEIWLLFSLALAMPGCLYLKEGEISHAASVSAVSCLSGVVNSAECLAPANSFVTSSIGQSVSLTTSLTSAIPAGYHDGTTMCTVADANLTTSNIKLGITILGLGGLHDSGPFQASNMLRDPVTTQVSQGDESQSVVAYGNSDPGYRAIPKILKDNDGYLSGSVSYVNRTGWNATTCGLTGPRASRIADCAAVFGAAATWTGATSGNAGHGQWKLVSRTGAVVSSKGREVWLDEKTNLVWSSVLSKSLHWCKASGSNSIGGNPAADSDPDHICDDAYYQAIAGQAVSACFEDDPTHFTNSDTDIDNLGKAGLNATSAPKVSWRLPTLGDFHQAELGGIRFVMPDAGFLGDFEWSATLSSEATYYAWMFDSRKGIMLADDRRYTASVRCVGHTY